MRLDTFFSPRSIAVIGASREPEKLGARVFANLRASGYRGTLIPVNPNAKKIDGIKAVPSLSALSRPVDLAIIVTPAPTVPDVLAECGRRGIKNVVIISAGFKEVGGDGVAREEAIRAVARRHRINLLGPNCLGFVHAASRLNASFGPGLDAEGDVVLISQSGAMAVAMTDWARLSRVRFRALVSLGNKAGLDEVDLLEHFAADPKTRTILFYLESIERGAAFAAAVNRAVRRTPVVILKAGESEQGRRAALSHTGALASDRAVRSAALEAAGAIQVETIEDLYDAAVVLSGAQRMVGNRVAIMTNAGGPAIMATDALAMTSLSLAPLASETKQKLSSALPAAASTANPIDLLGDAGPDRYQKGLDALLKDPNVDGVVALLTPQVVTDSRAMAKILAASRRQHKPVVASWLGGESVAEARAFLRANNVPHFAVPEDAVRALDVLHRASMALGRATAKRPAPAHRRMPTLPRGAGALTPPRATAVVRALGISCVPERFVRSAREAYAAARRLGFPVVLKRVGPTLLHKTDKKAVWVDLRTPAELARVLATSATSLPIAKNEPSDGFLLQPYLPGLVEAFIGGKRDPSFGPVVVIGVGGVDAELLHLTVTRAEPFSVDAVTEALARSSFRRWFTERRGRPAARLRAIAAVAVRIGAYLRAEPRVLELDLNPVFVQGTVARVADSRIILAQ